MYANEYNKRCQNENKSFESVRYNLSKPNILNDSDWKIHRFFSSPPSHCIVLYSVFLFSGRIESDAFATYDYYIKILFFRTISQPLYTEENSSKKYRIFEEKFALI